MTDTYSDPAVLAAISSLTDAEHRVMAELADRDRAEDAAIERIKAENREAFADAARRAAAERADRAEQAMRALFAAHYIGPAAEDEGLPCPEGEDLASIAETLFEDWLDGIALDQLDARALVRGWAEETGR